MVLATPAATVWPWRGSASFPQHAMSGRPSMLQCCLALLQHLKQNEMRGQSTWLLSCYSPLQHDNSPCYKGRSSLGLWHAHYYYSKVCPAPQHEGRHTMNGQCSIQRVSDTAYCHAAPHCCTHLVSASFFGPACCLASLPLSVQPAEAACSRVSGCMGHDRLFGM